jgi:hypothetical protein
VSISGKIVGYDPGGNDSQGVAALLVRNSKPVELEFDTALCPRLSALIFPSLIPPCHPLPVRIMVDVKSFLQIRAMGGTIDCNLGEDRDRDNRKQRDPWRPHPR